MLPFVAYHYHLAENLLSYADSERDLGVHQIPAGIWRFCPGRDFSRDFRCITSEKFTPTMPKVCPNYALCPNYAPSMSQLCPVFCLNYAPTMHQHWTEFPYQYIILSCIENHKFIINKTNGYENLKSIKISNSVK